MPSDCLRKLRLLCEDFPHSHNLVLIGQPPLLQSLALTPRGVATLRPERGYLDGVDHRIAKAVGDGDGGGNIDDDVVRGAGENMGTPVIGVIPKATGGRDPSNKVGLGSAGSVGVVFASLALPIPIVGS